MKCILTRMLNTGGEGNQHPPSQNVNEGEGRATLALCTLVSNPSVNPLCHLFKSYTVWKIFFKFGSNVHFNKAIFKVHVALVTAQGQNPSKVQGC